MPGIDLVPRFRTKNNRASMRLLVGLMCLLFFHHQAYAQTFDPRQLSEQNKAVDEFLRLKYARIDSLQEKIIHGHDTTKVDCLIQLYLAQLAQNTDSAFQTLQKAGSLAKKIGYHRGEASYYVNMADYYMETKNLPAAEKNLRTAASVYNTYHYDNEYYFTLRQLAYCLYWQLRFDEAFQIYQLSYNYFKRYPGDPKVAYVYRGIGKLLDAKGLYEQAFSYFLKDIAISKKMKDEKGSRKSYIINVNYYLGDLYLQMGDKKNALPYLKVSAEKALENIMPDVYDHHMGEIHFMSNNYDSARYYYLLEQNCWSQLIKDTNLFKQASGILNINVAKTYIAQKRYDTAIALLQNSLSYYSDNIFALDIYKYISVAYESIRNYDKALFYSRTLMSMAVASGARPWMEDAAEMHWKIFDALKQKDSAYKYLQMFKSISDSLSSDKQLRNIAAIEWKNANEDQQAQISLLNVDRKIKARQMYMLYLCIACLTVTGIFFIRHISLKRRHENANRLHAERELAIEKLEKSEVQAQFEKQVAELKMQALRAQMNPHFIFNSLNSINDFILKNDTSDASRYLTKFSRLIRLMLYHSQSSTITLHEELEALQLYIDMELLRFSDHFGYTISLPPELDASSISVPPLIIQPFVENAIWHGLMHKQSKGLLEIKFSIDNNKVYCEISDDGVGRKKTEELRKMGNNTYKSAGMHITTQRIAMLQNDEDDQSPITIIDRVLHDGSPGGTTIIIKLPVVYD